MHPLLLLAILWLAVGPLVHALPAAAGTLLSGGIAGTVAIAIFWAGRVAGRRETTLELHREYYSDDLAAARTGATDFMLRHRDVDWATSDPYVVGAGDADLAHYSTVVRFWHRVAVLYDEGEIDRGLAQRLMSRELGHWRALILEPMEARKDMWTRAMLVELARRFSIGERPRDFADGLARGRRLMARHAAPPRVTGGWEAAEG